MAGICVQSSPACTMTQEFTLCFHRALPSTAALLTRAPRFNYWLVSYALKPHQLSRTGNCLSPCKGGNWTGLWGNMHIHCSCVQFLLLLLLWCCELLADCVMVKLDACTKSSAGYRREEVSDGAGCVWVFIRHWGKVFAAAEAMRDISGSFYRKVVSTGEFKSYSQFLASPCFPPPSSSLSAWL